MPQHIHKPVILDELYNFECPRCGRHTVRFRTPAADGNICPSYKRGYLLLDCLTCKTHVSLRGLEHLYTYEVIAPGGWTNADVSARINFEGAKRALRSEYRRMRIEGELS